MYHKTCLPQDLFRFIGKLRNFHISIQIINVSQYLPLYNRVQICPKNACGDTVKGATLEPKEGNENSCIKSKQNSSSNLH